MTDIERNVQAHYSRDGLLQAILDGAEASGLGPDALTPQALAPVDEFHTAGRVTTLKALELTAIEAGMHILDAGCGIGGTARCLATERGCRVTGLDLTPDYVEVAGLLSARLGLDQLCQFDQGSVLQMPYAQASFDGAFSFHVAMNIDSRETFYAELARVLRRGAQLCIFDVMQGPTAGMHYPVPWAESSATSFLRTRRQTATLLARAGFDILIEEDLREFAIGFFREMFAQGAQRPSPPPLGLHLLTGANTGEKFANYLKALEGHQIEPVMVVASRQ